MITRTRDFRTWVQSNRLLWGFILVVVFSFLRFVETVVWENEFGSPDFHESIPFSLFLLFWFVLLSIGLVVGGIVWLSNTPWSELGWKRERLLRSVGLGCVGFLLLYIDAVVWAMLAGDASPPEMFMPDLGRLLLVIFFGFGLAAWVEENLYRGYMQPLLAERMGIGLAVIVQAIIFSIAHLGYARRWFDFGFAFVAGLILGWLRERGSSLVAPFIAHGLFWLPGAFMVVAP